MIGLALLLSTAFADDLVRPKRETPVEGECAKAHPLRVGEKPPVALVDPETGLVRCSAVAEPTSSLAYFLAVEKHRDGIERLWALDVRTVELERDSYRKLYVDAVNPPWYQKPTIQRWTGRFETLAVVGIVGGLIVAIGGAK